MAPTAVMDSYTMFIFIALVHLLDPVDPVTGDLYEKNVRSMPYTEPLKGHSEKKMLGNFLRAHVIPFTCPRNNLTCSRNNFTCARNNFT